MKQEGSETPEEELTMDRLDPGVREIISIISAHLDHVETTPRLDEYKEGDRIERDLGEPEVYNRLTDDLEIAKSLHGALKDQLAHHGDVTIEEVRDAQGKIPEIEKPKLNVERANACKILPADAEEDDITDSTHQISLPSNSVDLIVTSPPYWQKRDYGISDQLGQEKDPDDYVAHLIAALDRWRKLLRPHGSVFLNIGDTYRNKSLVGIPGRFVQKAQDAGWTIRNDIIWAKDNGMPSSAKDRLVSRHEHIIHLVWNTNEYYYDLHGYANAYGNGSNPGDVWRMNHDRNTGGHLAPYPEELASRAITLACPPAVCKKCSEPRERIRERGLDQLNTDRPQARRALQLYHESDLTEDHLRAIQATGISDAGKAKVIQDGAGANDETVQKRAKEAKDVLGGYFREFTFPEWTTVGWTDCECDSPEYEPGFVFDPFAGSGTTLKVANELRYHAWGTDLDTSNFDFDQSLARYQTELESESE